MNEIVRHEEGVMLAPPGTGKTLIGLAVASRRQQRTLILVHTRQLLTQWMDNIVSHTDIPAEQVGILSAGRWRVGDRLTIGSFQTLARRDLASITANFGLVIVDECHRVPAKTFTRVVRQVPARFVLGLTATPKRADGLERLIYFHLGDIIHRIDGVAIEPEPLLDPIIVVRKTSFECQDETAKKFHALGQVLIADDQRNRLIAADVITEVHAGHACLVLTDRRIHCEQLARLVRQNVACRVALGTMPQKERVEAIEALASGEAKVLIATGRLVGEGFDCPRLSCLFLTFPLSAPSRLIQYIGRLQRPSPGKCGIKVYDYHDHNVPLLDALFRKRKRVYQRMQGEARARLRERAQLKLGF